MARPASAVEAIRLGFDQPTNAIDDGSFRGEGVAVTGQHVEEAAGGHGEVSVGSVVS